MFIVMINWSTTGKEWLTSCLTTQLRQVSLQVQDNISFQIYWVAVGHGFMQDQIIASHTCFGEHMYVNC